MIAWVYANSEPLLLAVLFIVMGVGLALTSSSPEDYD